MKNNHIYPTDNGNKKTPVEHTPKTRNLGGMEYKKRYSYVRVGISLQIATRNAVTGFITVELTCLQAGLVTVFLPALVNIIIEQYW